jgi:hypothetical protein
MVPKLAPIPDLLQDPFGISLRGQDFIEFKGGKVAVAAPLKAIRNMNIDRKRHG